MNPLFAAALEIQTFCRAEQWRFCFIGALAVQRWGEPRLTLDVDVTLLTGLGTEAAFVDALLERFAGRIADARDFALRHRVLLIEGAASIPIDVALGAMPFEERAITRASDFAIQPGVVLTTCSAEDLIVFKAFAGRDKDWLDIDGIIGRQGDRLDQALIWAEAEPLLALKDAPEAARRLRSALARHRE